MAPPPAKRQAAHAFESRALPQVLKSDLLFLRAEFCGILYSPLSSGSDIIPGVQDLILTSALAEIRATQDSQIHKAD